MTFAALARHALRLAARRPTATMFFVASLGLGSAFLSATAHLLRALDGVIAARAAEILGGDLSVSSARPFTREELSAMDALVRSDRRWSETVQLASMLVPRRGAKTPFLVAVKAVDDAYPLRGTLRTAPAGVGLSPGQALLERSAALEHRLKAGDSVRLGSLDLRIAALIDAEPGRDLLGFSFAPRLLIRSGDLANAGLLGIGSRVRWTRALALAPGEDPGAASSAKTSLERRLADPHLSIATAAETGTALGDGLRRAGMFFTALSLTALLLGAAGLRAAVFLHLDAEAESMALLRCLGADRGQVSAVYAGQCVAAGIIGGAGGAAVGWMIAALLSAGAARLGLDFACPPSPAVFLECAFLGGALSWSLSTARISALVARSPLDAARSAPPASRRLAIGGWIVAVLVAFFAAWRRAPSAREAILLVAALAAGGLVVEILVRGILRLAGAALGRASALPFPLRHGFRRLERRPRETRVMLFTLAAGFALLAAISTARQGFSLSLAPTDSADAADLFLVDIQPDQSVETTALAAKFGVRPPRLAPLVRARLSRIESTPVGRAAGGEKERWRTREFNLTYGDSLNPAESVVAGRFWAPGKAGAEASVEESFLERAGLRLGSRLTFEVSGKEIEATVTSVRRVEWASMLPNFFVTLSPSLIAAAPHTFIASLRAKNPVASANLRRSLAERFPNVSVIDAAALVATVRRTLGLAESAVSLLAWFCVAVGAGVTAGLIALGRGERSEEASLERALGMGVRETLWSDAAELLGLGVLSATCAAVAAVPLGWALALRLKIPFSADPGECALLALAALSLPALIGLLTGARARNTSASRILRGD